MATTKLADITLTKQTGTTLSLSTQGKYVEDNLAFTLAVQSATTDSNTASANIEKESTDSSSIGGVNIYASLGTKQSSEPTSGYYIRLKAIGSGSSKITGAGWIQTGTLPAASTTASYFFPVTASTVTQNKPTIDSSTGLVSATASATAGYTPALTTAANTLQLSTVTATTVTPTEEAQTAVAAGKYTIGAVKVAGISTSYVGSAITRRNSASLSASGATVTAPAGYYASNATYAIASGSVVENDIGFNTSTGLITASATVSAGYVTASNPSKTLQLSTMAGTTKYATDSNQTVSTSGKYMLGNVIVSKLTGTGFSASNVKNGVTIKVNNGNADVFTAVGTFTKANTVSSGQTAATSGTILNGYSAWVNGQEVKGNITGTSVTGGVTTVSGESANRADASWGAGLISAGTMYHATFAKTATSGTTYVDISNTNEAPVLAAGDYLYINRGYTDDLKISLKKLVPDGSDIKGHSEYLLQNHTAYDNDGTLVTGNIQTLSAGNVTVSGKTITIPTQKYTGASGASQITVSVADGSYNASVSSHSITTSPTVTGVLAGSITDISTTSAVSGTDGTDYWTITPKCSVTATGKSSAVGKATILTAGYIPTGNTVSSTSTVSISATTATGTVRYIPKATVTVSGTNTVTPSAVLTGADGVVALSDTNNGIAVTATGGGTASVTAAAVTNQAGYAPASTQLGSATLNAANNTTSLTKYITTVNVPVAKSFTVTTTAGSSNDTANILTVTNNAKRKTNITNAANGTVTMTNSGTSTVTAASSSTGTLYVSAYNSSGTAENNKLIVSGGKWNATSASTTGTFYGRVTIGAGKVTSGTASIGTVSVTHNSSTGNFDISGQADVSAPSSDTTGMISASVGTRSSKPNGAVVSASIPIITGNTTFSGSTTYTPTITKQNVPSGVTQAASGAAVTTPPSSGVYVAVQSAANTGTLTLSPKITTAGYGTSTAHSISSQSITVGAAASTMTYIPITTANPVFNSPIPTGGSTAEGTNVTLSSTNNGIKIQTSYTVNTCSVTYKNAVAGWVSKAADVEAVKTSARSSTAGTAYYVTAVNVPIDKAFTVTNTADTELDSTSDISVTNAAYRRVNVTNSGGGAVIVGNSGSTTVTSGSVSAGVLTVSAYNASGTLESNKSIVSGGKWVATNVSTAGTFYGRVTVDAGSITNNTSGGTSSGTINRGSQIKISRGFYPEDLFYTAQGNNSGTLSITTSHNAKTNIGVDGYTNVNISGISVPVNNTFTVNTTANSSADSNALLVNNNAYRLTNVVNTANGSVVVTNSGSTTVSAGSTSAGTLIVSAYNASGTAENNKTIVSNGRWNATTVNTTGTFYGRVTVNTVTASISGGGTSGTATASGSSCTISDSTNNSGVSITTACSVTRAKVSCTADTAGWASGTIKELNANTTAMTAKTYYVNDVTLAKPSSGNRTFKIMAPDQNNTVHTYTFTTGTDGRTIINVDSMLNMEWNATTESLDFVYL